MRVGARRCVRLGVACARSRSSNGSRGCPCPAASTRSPTCQPALSIGRDTVTSAPPWTLGICRRHVSMKREPNLEPILSHQGQCSRTSASPESSESLESSAASVGSDGNGTNGSIRATSRSTTCRSALRLLQRLTAVASHVGETCRGTEKRPPRARARWRRVSAMQRLARTRGRSRGYSRVPRRPSVRAATRTARRRRTPRRRSPPGRPTRPTAPAAAAIPRPAYYEPHAGQPLEGGSPSPGGGAAGTGWADGKIAVGTDVGPPRVSARAADGDGGRSRSGRRGEHTFAFLARGSGSAPAGGGRTQRCTPNCSRM